MKADSYLALLAKRKASEEAARYGGMSKMLQGFAGGREGGIKGGGTAAGGMMEALVSGAGGAIGGGAGSVPDKEQMVKMAKKMTLVSQLKGGLVGGGSCNQTVVCMVVLMAWL